MHYLFFKKFIYSRFCAPRFLVRTVNIYIYILERAFARLFEKLFQAVTEVICIFCSINEPRYFEVASVTRETSDGNKLKFTTQDHLVLFDEQDEKS